MVQWISVLPGFMGGCRGRRHFQRVQHAGRYIGVERNNPDFAEVARLFGAHDERMEDPGGLRPAMEEALNTGKPAVLAVIIDRNEDAEIRTDLLPYFKEASFFLLWSLGFSRVRHASRMAHEIADPSCSSSTGSSLLARFLAVGA